MESPHSHAQRETSDESPPSQSASDLVERTGHRSESRTDRAVFYPVAIAAFAFCLTIFLCIAAAFGDQDHPATKWFNHHGTPLLLWETAAIVVLSILAMAVDRRRTLKRIEESQDSESGANNNVD
ncbi:MAG: hypothetical protein KDA80_01770 [Planctomycetaceae bacterium]|nr:hypothetical protein [Planctomycetaceae bacterium]